MTELKVKQFKNAEFLPEVVRLIDEGHTVTLLLRGISMRPFLNDNRDKAVLVGMKHVEPGIPVLAEVAKGHFVLHRIKSVNGDDIVLQGDGNNTVERCRRSDLRAEAIGFYRKGRTSIDYVSGMKWRIYSFIWIKMVSPLVRRYILGALRRVWKYDSL